MKNDCACRVVNVLFRSANNVDEWRETVVYCPKHAAVDEMYEVLEEIQAECQASNDVDLGIYKLHPLTQHRVNSILVRLADGKGGG